MMAAELPGFQPASELPPSASREDALEALVKSQAAIIEKLEVALDGPTQTPTQQTNMSPVERQKILQILSDLDKRITDQESLTAMLKKAVEVLQGDTKEDGQKIHEVHELAKYSLSTLSKRLTTIEDRRKPQDTDANLARVEAICQELFRRKAANQRGITYTEAAKVLGIHKARVCQLRALIAADSRLDIIWHPKKRNTKLICLKNYK